MVSHSVKIKEHKFRWKKNHDSVYECSQATLHLKLRGFEKIIFLSANVRERPTQKIQKTYYLLSLYI